MLNVRVGRRTALVIHLTLTAFRRLAGAFERPLRSFGAGNRGKCADHQTGEEPAAEACNLHFKYPLKLVGAKRTAARRSRSNRTFALGALKSAIVGCLFAVRGTRAALRRALDAVITSHCRDRKTCKSYPRPPSMNPHLSATYRPVRWGLSWEHWCAPTHAQIHKVTQLHAGCTGVELRRELTTCGPKSNASQRSPRASHCR